MGTDSLVLVTAPVAEPVEVADLEAQLQMRGSDQSSFLTGLIQVAREMIELFMNRALITQTWRWTLDKAETRFLVPMPPLQSVGSIKVYDWDDAATTQSSDEYIVKITTEPGEILLVSGYSWETHRGIASFEINFTAGYGDAASDIPYQGIKQAILQLAAKMYTRRGDDVNAMLLESDVLNLIQPYVVPEVV